MANASLRQLLHLDRASLADGSLLLSLHPDGSRLAAARGQTVCICPLLTVPAAESDEPAIRSGSAEGAIGARQRQEQQQQEQEQELEQEERQEEALRERRQSHGAAGPSGSTGRRDPPLVRFACPAANGPAAASPDDITALVWLAFARPPTAAHPEAARGRSSGGGGAGAAAAPAGRDAHPGWAALERRRTNSAGGGGGVFASIQVMVEDHELQRQERAAAKAAVPPHPHPGYSLVVLLSGTRGGALQLHDADSGAVLLRQQLHPGPVVSISVRTWRMGLNPTEAVEDVTVGWSDAVARLAAWELRAAATTCFAAAEAAAAEARARADRAGGAAGLSRFGLWGSSSSAAAAPAGPDIKPLAFQKWEVPQGAARGRSCVVCCGQRPRDLYSLLQGIGSSSPTATGKTIFLAGGNRPACLAALEVDEQASGGGGALSYISSVATSVWGLARTARNVAAAPLSIRGGLKYLGLTGGGGGGGGGAGPGGGGAGTAGGAATPLASFPDPTVGQRAPATGMWRQFRDDGRVVLTLAPAPHGSLVAAVDNLGRLLLVEVGAMMVSRMWKGYRDAQVAWMEVPVRSVRDLLERQRRDRQGGSPTRHPQQGPGQRQGQGPPQPERQRRQPMGGEHGGPSPAGAGRGPAGAPPGAQQQGGAGDSDEYVLLLAVYAPRRQTLELWFPLQGERLAAVAAPPKARLLQRSGGGSAGGELGTWRVADAASAAVPPMSPTRCMMCFAGTAPRLGLDMDLEEGQTDSLGEGLELVDVGSVFGLA